MAAFVGGDPLYPAGMRNRGSSPVAHYCQTRIVGPLSNANLALLMRMALRAKLPWTVIVGSDVTRAYKPTLEAYRNMAWILRLAPGEVMLAAAHNRDLAFAQRAGLGTAFTPRPTDHQ